MPTFLYEARERSGKLNKGKIDASSKGFAIALLKKEGLIVSSIKEEKKTVLDMEIQIGRPVKFQHIVIFLRQFATLIRAGVTIVESIRILSMQSESKHLRKILVEIEGELRQGIPLSEACARHKKVFEPLFLSMVRAGEASGQMELVLDRLAMFYEKSHYTREKIKSAMTYPITILILAVGVTIYLLTNIVPTFVGMFAGFGAELPAITKFVMALSDSLINTWYLYLLGFIATFVAYKIFVNTPYGRYYVDYAKIRMPIFGKLIQKGSIARMSRTLSTLFSSSVPILQALTIVEDVVGNKVIGEAIRKSQENLRQGRPLSEPLKKSWVFPPLVSQMIAVGEETGLLEGMLEKVADFYEKEVEAMVDSMKSLIEPIMIVFLAGIVGTIVMSIMIPMFDIFSKVH
jgi:type IV pilus assembly protein PilC